MRPQTDFSTLVGLVSHYSPSGQEHGVVEWLVARLCSLGYSRAFIDEAGNAVGVMGSGPRQVVLLGHIDTVTGEIKVSQDATHLHGRGTVDAKGPLACFVDAVAQIGNMEGWQFVVIGAVEEERDSDGARFVTTQYQPDYAIIGEPNHWNRIALGYKGSASASVTVKRDKSHSASGEKTAPEEVVDVWLKIKTFIDQYNMDKPKIFDKILLSLKEINSDADDFEGRASLKINARLPVDTTPEDWYATLQKIIKNDENNQIAVEQTGFAISAWRCEKNTSLVRAFLKSIRMQGGEPGFAYKTGTADLNIVAPVWKCPMVVYGPGDSSLDHTPKECIELLEYTKAVEVLVAALSALVISR